MNEALEFVLIIVGIAVLLVGALSILIIGIVMYYDAKRKNKNRQS